MNHEGTWQLHTDPRHRRKCSACKSTIEDGMPAYALIGKAGKVMKVACSYACQKEKWRRKRGTDVGELVIERTKCPKAQKQSKARPKGRFTSGSRRSK